MWKDGVVVITGGSENGGVFSYIKIDGVDGQFPVLSQDRVSGWRFAKTKGDRFEVDWIRDRIVGVRKIEVV